MWLDDEFEKNNKLNYNTLFMIQLYNLFYIFNN